MSNQDVMNVYYEVTDAGKDPIVEFIGPRKAGFGSTKSQMVSKMITSTAEKYPEFNGQLRIMQVESLTPVCRTKVTRDEDGHVVLSQSQLKSLFVSNGNIGIPLVNTFNLLVELQGLRLDVLCRSLGITTDVLNDLLTGLQQPSDLIRSEMLNAIGIDPWQYAEWLGPVVIQEEMVSVSSEALQGSQFLSWLKQQVLNNKLAVNTKAAAVHIVDEGVFLLAPRAFRLYLAAHGIDEAQHVTLSKRFDRLNIHLQIQGRSIHSYQLMNKTKAILNGWVIPTQYVFGEGEVPEKNKHLVRCIRPEH